jgi:hypothetical protein
LRNMISTAQARGECSQLRAPQRTHRCCCSPHRTLFANPPLKNAEGAGNAHLPWQVADLEGIGGTVKIDLRDANLSLHDPK